VHVLIRGTTKGVQQRDTFKQSDRGEVTNGNEVLVQYLAESVHHDLHAQVIKYIESCRVVQLAHKPIYEGTARTRALFGIAYAKTPSPVKLKLVKLEKLASLGF
jgi:hypothetical protein